MNRSGRMVVLLCVASTAWVGAEERIKIIEADGSVRYSHLAPGNDYLPLEQVVKGKLIGKHPAADYTDPINDAAVKYGLVPALLDAVVRAESYYQPGAVSPQGAVGMTQLMPGTARKYGVKDRRNTEQSLAGGAAYLRDLLIKYERLDLALAGYNAGEAAVEKHKGIPPFSETKAFVKRVIRFYRQNLQREMMDEDG